MKLQLLILPLFAFTLVFQLSVLAQSSSVDDLIEEAEAEFEAGDERKSLQLYEEVLEADPDNYEALWNASILYAREGYRKETESEQERYYQKALDLAEKSKEVHPDKGHSYYALAVAHGRMTEVLGTRDRIRTAHVIRDNVEKAADMIPDYAPVWHLWGVWHSDVANVSRVARMAARFISKGLPDGSNEKAEEYLKKAIDLDESRILFRIDLARHYLETGEDEKAKEVLKELVKMEPSTIDDPLHLEEARELLEELQ